MGLERVFVCVQTVSCFWLIRKRSIYPNVCKAAS